MCVYPAPRRAGTAASFSNLRRWPRNAGANRLRSNPPAPDMSPYLFAGAATRQWPMGLVNKERLFGSSIKGAEERLARPVLL
jgi:hypothetical protein